MYEEKGPDGRRAYTVAQIAAEFGVTRPTDLPSPGAQCCLGLVIGGQLPPRGDEVGGEPGLDQ